MRLPLQNSAPLKWLRRQVWRRQRPHAPRQGSRIHVIILDGTMSSLQPGQETHAGLTYKLICEADDTTCIYYEPGLQWTDWRATWAIMTGKGINRQIRRAYGYLAARYRPGDRIFLFGFSRGAYAARSLAGFIDRIGLLEARHATEQNIDLAYEHYRSGAEDEIARAFRTTLCHTETPIEMVGVWDTVKALGLRLPVLWRFSEPNHAFHNHALGGSIRHGFHALAHDERRLAYAPVLWEVPDDHEGRVEQVWFPGNHGVVGGQINGDEAARPLSYLSLLWLLGRAEACGLPLPDDWRARFPADAQAPDTSHWRGWSKLFVLRAARRSLQDPSERLHPAILARRAQASEEALPRASLSQG